MAAAAVVLGLTAWKLYPKTVQQPAPSFATLIVMASTPVADVFYNVTQVSPAISKVVVEVDANGIPAAGKRTASVDMLPPLGTFFQDCPHPACITLSRGATGWLKDLTFKPHTFKAFNAVGWLATTNFLVKADHFGITFNGLNAAAALPDITYTGPGKPFMQARYPIPAAASYDWSLVPEAETSSVAQWEEPLAEGGTAGQDSIGVNHAAQKADDAKTFIAGALIGLAGAAILAAAVEVLHVRDWDALRSKQQPATT